jgi:excisionase family DNA binding protein
VAFLFRKGHIVADKTIKPGLLPVLEAAAFLSVSEATVRRAIRAGELPCVRIGRLVRVSLADLVEFTAIRRIDGGVQ